MANPLFWTGKKIAAYVKEQIGKAGLTLDDTVTEASDHGVKSSGIWTWVVSKLSGKQDTLVSGTNIKSINNEPLLGSGNIQIDGTPSDYDTVRTNASAGAEHAAVTRGNPHGATGSDIATSSTDSTTLAKKINSKVDAQPTAIVYKSADLSKYPVSDFKASEEIFNTTYAMKSEKLASISISHTGTFPITVEFVSSTMVRTLVGFRYKNTIKIDEIELTGDAVSRTFEYNTTTAANSAALNGKADTAFVQSFKAVGGQTPTVENGVADLTSWFSQMDTSKEIEIDNLLHNSALEKSIKICAEAYGGNGIKYDTESGRYYFEV